MVDGPIVGAFSEAEDSDSGELTLSQASRVLRARWRSASLAAGWRFPSDWGLPEIDSVCASVVADGPTESAVSGLGRARAAAGAGLDETLVDLAALHAVLVAGDGAEGFILPEVDATPARLLRLTAVAWADVALDQLTRSEVNDPLTGLPTASYLRTRLAEVYRRSERLERPASEDSVLLAVSMDLRELTGWPRLTAMILAADVVRSVFDGGETVAALGPSALAVLAGREPDLPTRAVALRREINESLAGDPQLHGVALPSVRVVRLAPTFAQTCMQLAVIGRI